MLFTSCLWIVKLQCLFFIYCCRNVMQSWMECPREQQMRSALLLTYLGIQPFRPCSSIVTFLVLSHYWKVKISWRTNMVHLELMVLLWGEGLISEGQPLSSGAFGNFLCSEVRVKNFFLWWGSDGISNIFTSLRLYINLYLHPWSIPYWQSSRVTCFEEHNGCASSERRHSATLWNDCSCFCARSALIFLIGNFWIFFLMQWLHCSLFIAHLNCILKEFDLMPTSTCLSSFDAT